MTARRSFLPLFLAVGVAIAFACHERARVRFPHELHLAKLACGGPGQPACLGCADCHRSEPGGEPQKPMVSECEGCHGAASNDKLAQSIRSSHSPVPRAHQIAFDHGRHLVLSGIDGQCVRCHGGTVKSESTLFPPMAECFSCHEHQAQFDQGECGPCHAPGDVQTLRPETFMRHDPAWLRHHGHDANANPAVCQSCHEQAQCDDCHDLSQSLSLERRRPERLEATFVHPADFLSRHALEARSMPSQCQSCHQPETCDACHVQRGVSANAFQSRNPHPPGWVGGNPASLDFHGRAARRDIVSCAGCHDQGPATNCIDCHRVGGPGGNPHPRGFFSLRSQGDAMCQYCHVE